MTYENGNAINLNLFQKRITACNKQRAYFNIGIPF